MKKSIYKGFCWLSLASRQLQGSSVLRVAVAFRRFEERSAKGTMPPFPQRSGVEVVQGVAGVALGMSVAKMQVENPELFLGFCL
jgi:hypothetical protein